MKLYTWPAIKPKIADTMYCQGKGNNNTHKNADNTITNNNTSVAKIYFVNLFMTFSFRKNKKERELKFSSQS